MAFVEAKYDIYKKNYKGKRNLEQILMNLKLLSITGPFSQRNIDRQASVGKNIDSELFSNELETDRYFSGSDKVSPERYKSTKRRSLKYPDEITFSSNDPETLCHSVEDQSVRFPYKKAKRYSVKDLDQMLSDKSDEEVGSN